MRHGRKPRGPRPGEIAGAGGVAPAEGVVAEPVAAELESTEPGAAAEAVAASEATVAAEAELDVEPVSEHRAIADVEPDDEPSEGPSEELREPEPGSPSQLDLGVIEDLVEALAEPLPLPAAQPSWDDDTAVRRRLASIYLRTGSLTAAHVELESLGGRNLLEGRGLLDLAEVRWRTGDRAGAGVAAGSYLDAGGDDGLGFVIVAEAAAEAGRQDEARGHLAEAAGRLSDLVRAYAGMPSRVIQAPAGAEPPPAVAVAAPTAAELPPAEALAAPAESAEPPAPPVPPEPAVAPADLELAAAAAVLGSGDPLLAAVHFGIALRTEPGSAQAVLDAIGDRHDAALELVRGDALRLLGRDDEAARAYRAAASALAGDEVRKTRT
jgi:hypothetical protein